MNFVYFSPDSAVLAAALSDGSVRIWSASSGATVATLTGGSRAAACCVAWSNDEAAVAEGGGDGNVEVWEAGTGLLRGSMQCPQAASVAHMALSSDGSLIAAAVGPTASCVHVFDVASGKLLASPAVRGSVQQLQWSVHARLLQDDHGHVWTAP